MSQSSEHFEHFEDHTQLKHAILRSYLLQWCMILLNKGVRRTQVCFVDAFAGAGRDQQGNKGSPLLAVDAMQAVNEQSRAGNIVSGASLRVVLVEKKPSVFQEMESTVRAAVGHLADDVRFFKADYRARLPAILEFANGAPTLWFLDPYGVKGLSAKAFQKILAPPKSEVLVLVSGIGASRLAGTITATADAEAADLQRIQESLSLFPDHQQQDEERATRKLQRTEEAIDVTSAASRVHLIDALGSDAAADEFAKVESTRRPEEFVRRLQATLREAGASHLVTIPMRDEAGHYKYTLIHASKSLVAAVTMKEAISTGLRKGGLADSMREQMMDDLRLPTQPFVDHVARTLRGLSMPWSSESARTPLLKRLLENTRLFHFQAPEIKGELKRRGWFYRGEDRKEWVAFPP